VPSMSRQRRNADLRRSALAGESDVISCSDRSAEFDTIF
jgi:hypothetical protein